MNEIEVIAEEGEYTLRRLSESNSKSTKLGEIRWDKRTGRKQKEKGIGQYVFTPDWDILGYEWGFFHENGWYDRSFNAEERKVIDAFLKRAYSHSPSYTEQELTRILELLKKIKSRKGMTVKSTCVTDCDEVRVLK